MRKYLSIFAILLVNVIFAQSGTISTVVGTGVSGNSGDSSAATSAQINTPQGIVFDSDSNMYIADPVNSVIRKVATSGIIYTIAGTGVRGYNGDGIKAAKAKLHSPAALAIDTSDNIYVADLGNQRIRKIDHTTGLITTVAGNGTYGFGGDGGAASIAILYNPSGVAVDDSGNVIIADTRNHRIRKVFVATGLIYTIAGTGTPSLSGNGGQASAATLNYPTGVCVDSVRNIFIADKGNSMVRKITASTGVISAFAGTGVVGYSGNSGAATSAKLDYPTGVSMKKNSATVYIADQGNQVIRKVVSGTITNYAGNATGAGTLTGGYSGDGGAATSAKLNLPYAISFSPTGDAYISDSKNNVVRKVLK